MEQTMIFNWVINALIFSLPFSWYMCYRMYKDLKKKDKIIELSKSILDEKLKIEEMLKELEEENHILKQKIKERVDFNYEIACKFYSLKNRVKLYIKNPLRSLLKRNERVKDEYKLAFIDKELISKVLNEIEALEIEIK